jgi:hypothetical protein
MVESKRRMGLSLTHYRIIHVTKIVAMVVVLLSDSRRLRKTRFLSAGIQKQLNISHSELRSAVNVVWSQGSQM